VKITISSNVVEKDGDIYHPQLPLWKLAAVGVENDIREIAYTAKGRRPNYCWQNIHTPASEKDGDDDYFTSV